MLFASAAEQMEAEAAAYDPSMYQFYDDAVSLPDTIRKQADAMAMMVSKARNNWPLDPLVADLTAAMHEVQLLVAETAKQIAPGFAAAHEVDLARRDNPRPDEHRWNV